MLLSLGLIIILSLSLTALSNLLKIPSLIGYIITGIILGPYVLDLVNPAILNISSELRKIALIVILFRAGLTLNIKDLKKVGRGAFLLAFLPATIEIIVIGLLSMIFLGITLIEGLILGSIVAAVSPAVIVPRMIELIRKKLGTKKAIPQMILASSSIDDVYVIVLFTIFIKVYQSNIVDFKSIILFPISLLSGIFIGIFFGFILVKLFKRFHMRDTVKILLLFGFAFIFDYFESIGLPFASLLAIISLGITTLELYPKLAERLTEKFSKIWVIFEIILFVLIGALVNIYVINTIGLKFVLLLIIAIIFRFFAVYLSTSKINLLFKERLFVFFSYLPKATVQAAIGAIPLALGMPAGEMILAISVLSIFITAPFGAVLIDRTQEKLLN